MDPLRISLFGGIRLERGSAPPVPIPSAAGRSLLAYLVTHRDRGHTRGLLAGKLWPEFPEQTARRRLSQALWQVQTVLAELSATEPYLVSESSTLRFNTNAPYWLDVEEFERAVGEARGTAVPGSPHEMDLLRHAVELYAGDFLEGFYEKWDDYQVDQTRYRDMYLDTLGRLVQLSKSNGSYDAALTYARRIVGQDPLREDAHRERMRLYLLKGQTTEAIRAYEECRGILAQELNTIPDAETEALRDRVLEVRRKGVTPITALSDSPVSSAAVVPFVGRDTELAALVGRLDDCIAGRGGMILIEGGAGIGKTRLLAELGEAAAWRTMEVLWSACSERAPLRPYAPIREALESAVSHEIRLNQLAGLVDGVWLREVSRIVPKLAELENLPEASPLKAEDETYRMQEAIARTMVGLGKVIAHVAVLEDVQWADEDSLAALERLGSLLAGSSVLVIVSYRGDEMRQRPEAWDLLRRIDRNPGVARLLLGPLEKTESAELVRRAIGQTTVGADLADSLYYHMGGNPAFTLESLRLLLDQQASDGFADLAAIPIPDSVHDVVARRLAWLGDEVLPVAQALAVHGLSDRAAVETMCPGEQIDRPLDLLQRHGHVVVDQGGYRFAQGAHQQVVYEAIDPERRRWLHRIAADLIEARSPDDIEVLALHFSEGDVAEKALPFLHKAALRASSAFAYRTAASYFERAVALIDRSGVDEAMRAEVLMAAEHVFDVLGRRSDQKLVLDMVDGSADLELVAEIELRRARLLAQTDQFGEAVAAAKRSLALNPGLEGQARIALALALSWWGRPAESIHHLEAAADAKTSDPVLTANARAALGSVLAELQQYEEAEAQLGEALAGYQAAGDSRGEAETLWLLGTISMERGSVAEAERYASQSLAVSRSIGYLHGHAVSIGNLGTCRLYKGLIFAAVQAYNEAAEVFGSIGNRRGAALVGINLATVRLSTLGDAEQAAETATDALQYFEEIGHLQGQANCLSILGGVERLRGNMEAARQLLETGLDRVFESGHRWSEVLARRSLAMLELQEGHYSAAMEHLDIAETTSVELGLDDVQIVLNALRGLALSGLGETEAAVAATRDAVDRLHDGVEQPHLIYYWHHLTSQAAGNQLEAAGAIREAHDRLHACLEGFDSEQRIAALTRVPEQRDIVQRWEALLASQVKVQVPRADAPLGRPLRDDDYVDVRWTINAPTDSLVASPIELRRLQILRLLDEAAAQGALPTVDQLADVLYYSVATVKRDIQSLRNEGHDVHTRGARRPTS